MRIVMFSQSLISDWNNPSAHFLRGVASELLARGHELRLYEPADSPCLSSLLRERGVGAVAAFHDAFPELNSVLFDPLEPELPRLLDGADLVLVDAWNRPELIAAIGAQRARSRRFRLLFHCTPTGHAYHGAAAPDLRSYDGVLAYTAAVREQYLARGWADNVLVWHEAADTRTCKPLPPEEPRRDLVWIGDWSEDADRSHQLQTFILQPSERLQLSADMYGAGYALPTQRLLATHGARYRGVVYNFEVPRVLAAHRVTVHVPRPSTNGALCEVPSLRVFEALACGIPLVCAPWRDAEGLFAPGEDYLVARDPEHMTELLRAVLHDSALAADLRTRGLASIARRHTCAHRVDELLTMYTRLTRTAPAAQAFQPQL